ncbi:hypothetical protein V565_102880 [Rhizoctonia solani 123E]|uniref:Fungal-type protein kinase domain-containing protein n=1 Tax=Rhizoctonia solani 123E TaxID=1423351 RepID=A0A074SH46_9AGAM|nr:hypothetical protein V565_102880 [Rhizoctonia solani 123E]
MSTSSADGLIPPSVSISSQSTNEEDSSYTQEPFASSFYAALEKSETCDVDQLVAVFLHRCRATEPPNDPSIGISQSENSFPCSTSESPSKAVANSGSPATDSERTLDIPPVTRELFDSCLQKVIPTCNSPKMRRFVEEYTKCQTETSRYMSFVELANHALASVESLELPELRKASTSNVLFHVNHKKAIKGIKGSKHFPDIVLVPLASAQRVHQDLTDSWEECTKKMGTQRDRFDWPDVLMTGEMKWHLRSIDSQLPEIYGTDPKDTLQSITTHADALNFASILSEASASGASGSTTASGGLISPSSTQSGSTQGSAPSATKAHESDAVSSSIRGRKRRGDHTDQRGSKGSTSKKIKTDNLEPPPQEENAQKPNHSTKEDILQAMLQLGTNAAEMLRCSRGRRHAFGMIIIDSIVWIWWFDRQGAIQSTGINFIKNLPRFLVFLLAIQRFDLADWGFDEELDPSIPLRHTSDARPTPQRVEYQVDNKAEKLKVNFTSDIEENLHEVFSLKGKSTNVFKVTAPGQPPLVAKLYWPNHNRAHEVKIINHACEDPHLLRHLPGVRGWRNIDAIGTRRIRDQLGICSNSPCLPRQFIIIIFEELFPMTMLRGDHLVFVWLQCVRTHYLLWEKGIRHLDLSLGNLMYRQEYYEGKTKYYGVLNDWDLGDDENNLVESRKDLTKTVLFTSLDLLQASPHEAQVVQRYSHDLESFIWILIWVFLAVEGGEIKPNGDMDKWQTSNPRDSVKERAYFLWVPGNYQPHEEWQSQWLKIYEMLYWLVVRKSAQDVARAQATLKKHHFDAHETTIKNEVPDQNQAFHDNQNNDSDQDETPNERKELLRSLLETLKHQYVESTPLSPVIQGL